jgi:hypothetical protein
MLPRVLAPYLLVLPFAITGSALGALSDVRMLAVVIASLLCVSARAVVEWVRIEHRRTLADGWIASHAGSPPDDHILRARLAELARPKLWLALANTLQSLSEQATDPRWALHSPNRRWLAEHAEAFALVSSRLADVSRPPTPRGVAVVHQLLTRGDGPLYNPTRTTELTTTLSNALRLLDD